MGLMGVLTEIGIMRCVVVVLLSVSACAAGCPSLCSCRGGGGGGGGAGEPPPDEQLRLRCGPSPAQITELKEVDFTNISGSVVSLNMSGNAISTLSRELHLPNLLKLDLSRNQISLIESDAFYNVSALQRLDLSHNQIAAVSRDMFKGLASLERLLLAHNLLTTLSPDTFDHLVSLKLLDIAENPFSCSCALVWLGAWLHGGAARLAAVARCAAPAALAGKPLRKLRNYLDPAHCGAAPAPLLTRPARDQLAFEGDSLALVCTAPAASALRRYELRWAHPALDTCDVNVTSADVADEGVAETVARFDVTPRHAGDWVCSYSDERAHHERRVNVVVLGNGTRYCPTNVTVDNKGLYSWPQLLLNRTAEVPCRAGGDVATRACGADGAWRAANTSRCAYIANVTKLLQQFALLDVSLVQYSALNASARLAALLRDQTYPLAELQDPDDVMFVAQAVDSYMRYLPEERDLGSALLDVIDAAMQVPPAVMARAEAQAGACSRLVRAAERLAQAPGDKQKSNLAVESFGVGPGWSGATCVWYSPDTGDAARDVTPRLHCTTTNRTVARMLSLSDARVLASVQIPASLVFSLRPSPASLVVGVFRDAALFPRLPEDAPDDAHRAKDYYGRSTKREDVNMEITSPVVSVRLTNGSLAGALLEPMVVLLRALGCGGSAQAAVWDPNQRRWYLNDTECAVLQYSGCTAALSLRAPCACALLARAERGIFGARTHGARFKPSHPAVYVGSLLLAGCLAGVALTYAAAFPALRMPRAAKHAHVNTWLAVAALALLYALGVYQTEQAVLCRALGLAIHYLSLSALLWQAAAARALLAALAPAPPPRDERAPGSVLGLYLTGWGAALIVVGISGAVDVRRYAGYAQCFLSGAALAALFLPAAGALLALAALMLRARCLLRAARTELLELEPRDAPRPSGSLRSLAADAERAPAAQLRAQAAVLALYVATWTSAAVAVYRPLPAYLPYQEDICSILYAICATVLGTFVLFFYGIARSDVRAQWALMHCYIRPSERCCRDRSVFDSARSSAPPAAPPGDNRGRSGSRGSDRTSGKTDNDGYKAVELDPLKNTNNKNAVNLMVLHQRQYRSDRSVLTTDDGADAFYNPNQMNVAKKFFKRQRQNVKRNRLELPTRRDLDVDSHRSLPLSAEPSMAGLVGAGSKVNNTNIHVDRSLGLKEPRRGNPNLLEEDDDYKCYSVDRKSWSKPDDAKKPVVNIYTNVGLAASPVRPAPRAEPDTRTVSAQCSLDYSSSEPAPRSRSPPTPDTPSEPGGADPVTDTESIGRYVARHESLRDVSEENGRSARTPAGDEDASDIYCPPYQASEVSIRSHGLYAPSPRLSAEDVRETQYANLPRRSPDSELDDLYTHIARPADVTDADLTASDVTLRPDSDSCVSCVSEPRAETAV